MLGRHAADAARGRPRSAEAASEIEVVDLEVKIAELTGQLHEAKIEVDSRIKIAVR